MILFCELAQLGSWRWPHFAWDDSTIEQNLYSLGSIVPCTQSDVTHDPGRSFTGKAPSTSVNVHVDRQLPCKTSICSLFSI